MCSDAWKRINLVVGFSSWIKIFNVLFENQKRWLAAEKATELGRGGIAKVIALTDLSRNTIKRGMQELESHHELDANGQVRKPGAGRKIATETNPKLVNDITKGGRKNLKIEAL